MKSKRNQHKNVLAIARYTLAVDRRFRREDAPKPLVGDEGFLKIPDGIEDELPFN